MVVQIGSHYVALLCLIAVVYPPTLSGHETMKPSLPRPAWPPTLLPTPPAATDGSGPAVELHLAPGGSWHPMGAALLSPSWGCWMCFHAPGHPFSQPQKNVATSSAADAVAMTNDFSLAKVAIDWSFHGPTCLLKCLFSECQCCVDSLPCECCLSHARNAEAEVVDVP